MKRQICVSSVVIGIMFIATTSLSQVPSRFKSGTLLVQPIGTPACAGKLAVIPGQQVDISGSGFAASSSVTVSFRCCDGFESQLGPLTSDGSGGINATVTIPSGFIVPDRGSIVAFGPGPSTNVIRRLTSHMVLGPPSTSDGDSDGFADFCDNCPSISNSDQADADGDEIGDLCDACPNDVRNDADGDGLCEDVDVCPLDANNDADQDGVCGNVDNCPNDANATQQDVDNNGIGDACQTVDTCSDGIDNDKDGRVDFPADKGCDSATDSSELNSLIPCDDGVDNDSDGLYDFRIDQSGDPGCGFDTASTTAPENPECDDGIDNDSDGLIDWDGDFGLTAPDPECQGFGFGTSETVPEPSLSIALAIGVLGIAAVSSSFRLS